MDRNRFREQWLTLQKKYERQAYRRIINVIQSSVKKIPFDEVNELNYASLIRRSVKYNNLLQGFYSVYLLISRDYGEKIGQSINQQIKRFDPSVFANMYRRDLITWVGNNAGQRIVSLNETLIEHIVSLIEKGIEEGSTIFDIARQMESIVNSPNFYRWQALRIARTESTSAANYGAVLASEASNLVLTKEWLSADDLRVRTTPPDRYDHRVMDGVKIDQYDLFDVQGSQLRFPGDPKGQAGAVINCRCTLVFRPKKDQDGNFIFKN